MPFIIVFIPNNLLDKYNSLELKYIAIEKPISMSTAYISVDSKDIAKLELTLLLVNLHLVPRPRRSTKHKTRFYDLSE